MSVSKLQTVNGSCIRTADMTESNCGTQYRT